MPLLLFLIPLTIFYIWRPWLRLHGERWKPEGRWVSRTEASAEYLERTQGPPTNGQRVATYVLVAAMIVYVVVFSVWGVPWLESLNDRGVSGTPGAGVEAPLTPTPR